MSEKKILFVTYADFLNPVLDQFDNNSGNGIFYSAGMSYFYSDKLKPFVEFATWDMVDKQPDYINSNFDALVYMEANIFATYFVDAMNKNVERFKKIKIPVYILGAGAQSDINYSFDFVKEIETPAKRFVDTILNTGGKITLRGEFTNEVLKKLGYNNLFVSGCPSVYYSGRNHKITNQKVDKDEFRPMLNGNNVRSIDKRIYKNYPNGVFFSQFCYLDLLFRPDCVKDLKSKVFRYPFKELYINKRIQGNTNPYLWRKQIHDGGFNFSYGLRIHGNIVALQEGVPAFVKVIDSRTRELVEFFNIPNSMNRPFNESKEELYDLYKSLNYDEFNNNLQVRFDAFKKFLDDNNLPNCLGENEEFKQHIKNIDYPAEVSEIKIRKDIYDRLPNKFFLLPDILNFS